VHIVIYFSEIIYLSSSFFSPFGASGTSFFSPAIRYSPEAHFPRSINLHRSEQKGLKGLPSHAVTFLQTGHLISVFFSFAVMYCLTTGACHFNMYAMGTSTQPFT
jgi:hypothetical protein